MGFKNTKASSGENAEYKPAAVVDKEKQGANASTAWPKFDDFSLQQVRELLLAPEREELNRLNRELLKPAELTKTLSEVLPAAISLRSKQDKAVHKSLLPVVSENINETVFNNPGRIVDAIYPILGPAIKKAIQSAIEKLVQSINVVVQNTVSLRALKWRVQSIWTGRQLAEIVLLNSLIYRVEQVFLVDKTTGLPIIHRVADLVPSQDPDLVAGMLSAIQDFVRDSFETTAQEGLSDIKVSDLNVLIESGRNVYIAAVVRGTPPYALREVLREALLAIDLEKSSVVEKFPMVADAKEELSPYLTQCFKAEIKPQVTRISPLLWIVAILAVLGLGYLIGTEYRRARNWSSFITLLNDQPGIQVLNDRKSSGTRVITGIRDSLSQDPADIFRKQNLDFGSVKFVFDEYSSHIPKFVIERAKTVLKPPETVNFSFFDGILTARGIAGNAWIEKFNELAVLLAGVRRVDSTHLVNDDLRKIAELEKTLKKLIYFPDVAITHCEGRSCHNKFRSSQGGFRLWPELKLSLPAEEVASIVNSYLELSGILKKPKKIRLLFYNGRQGLLDKEASVETVIRLLSEIGINQYAFETAEADSPRFNLPANFNYVYFDVSNE